MKATHLSATIYLSPCIRQRVATSIQLLAEGHRIHQFETISLRLPTPLAAVELARFVLLNHLGWVTKVLRPARQEKLLLVLDVCNVDQLPFSKAGKVPSEPRLPTHATSIPRLFPP
jgi:hypothetical protein